MKVYYQQSKFRLFSFCLAACSLLLGLPASAYVLDNFTSGKNGWTDNLNGGTAAVASGVFTLTTATANGSLTSSTKTSLPVVVSLGTVFTPINGNTLELRVDANTTLNASVDTNKLAILALVPTGGTILTDGYSLIVGANDVKIQHGSTVLFSTNGVNFSRTNITLCLRISPSGGSVTVNARVYQQIPNGLLGQYQTAFFEQTVTDGSASLVGVAANVALGVQNAANPSGVSVAYDNVQVWDVINSTLDDFSSGNLNNWTTFSANTSGDSITTHDGLIEFVATPNAAGGFAGAVYKNRSFLIQDGARVEFVVDVINNIGGLHSYSVIGFTPATGATAVSFLRQLVEYHLAVDTGNTYNGKQYNGWWGHTTGAFPSANMRLTLTMTGEGTNCRIESRAEDTSLGINDPARLYYQNVVVDTSVGSDSFEGAVSSGLKPAYLATGSFAIDIFNDSVITADVQMDNARFNQTLPPNLPPILNNLSPGLNQNSVDASTAHVVFDAVDDINIAAAGLVLTLNGVSYTNGSPGVAITGTQTSRHFDLSGALAANVNYVGTITLTDTNGANNVTPLAFDTFLTNNFLVESEEYNYNSGSYLDTPGVIAEGGVDSCCAYNGQIGTPGVDFNDNRGTGAGPGYGPTQTFRYDDVLRTGRSSDFVRAKYSDLGGAGSGYYETIVEDIRDGDWMNYTHHYPAGTYKVFMRQSQYAVPITSVSLDLVNSDPTQPNQTNISSLGSFIGASPGGPTEYKNIPLTDASGNPVVVRFDGSLKTLRITQHLTGQGENDSAILQNYFVFIPTPDPGTLRPIISYASPTPGATVAPNGANVSSSPATTVSIANRDTSVNVGSVVFSLNGSVVGSAVVAPVTGGATVTWPFGSLPATAIITNSLTFADSDGTNQTFTWTYSYPFLRASNSLPDSAITTNRGFRIHTVWNQNSANGGATLGNSLLRAEGQLSYPPVPAPEPGDISVTNVTQVLYWNNDNATPNDVPGLSSGPLDNIATESIGYMRLTAGAHRFHVSSDDGFEVRFGSTPTAATGVVPGYRDDGTFDNSFDFIVEATGNYPVRVVWYENGGGANFRLNSVDPATATEVLVNDPGDPAGVVKVFQPIIGISLYSSATVGGTYTIESGAVIDTGLKTATLPLAGSTRFYKMTGTSLIINVKKVGSNIVLTYQ